MKVRLAKIAGDDNRGDYTPKEFWVEGSTDRYPHRGYCFLIYSIYTSYDVDDSPERFIISSVHSAYPTQFGYLIVADHALWALTIHEDKNN